MKGIGYWNAPKTERVKELTAGLWRPRLIALFYALEDYLCYVGSTLFTPDSRDQYI
jgi:hypothetical protein